MELKKRGPRTRLGGWEWGGTGGDWGPMRQRDLAPACPDSCISVFLLVTLAFQQILNDAKSYPTPGHLHLLFLHPWRTQIRPQFCPWLAPYLSSLSLSVTFTERTYSIHHYLIHSFYFSTLLISLSELFTIGCQDTIVSCVSSFSARCSTAVPFAFLLLSPPLNVGVPRGSPSGLSTLPLLRDLPQSYHFIYVQDSQMSLSPAQTSSPKSDSYPTINLTPPWRSNTLRCPKSISQLSLHRPIFNLLSLTRHQHHYSCYSGQNLRVMFNFSVSLLPHIPAIRKPCLPSK